MRTEVREIRSLINLIENFGGQRITGNNSIILEAVRTSMSEFFGDTTDNVDTLLKMFSKYAPNRTWFMTVGYVNDVSLSVTVNNENLERLENAAKSLNNPAFTEMINSAEWKLSKTSGKNYKSPFAGRTQQGIKIPSSVYSSKNFTIQWGNILSKSDKDAAVKAVYDKHGVEWVEGGEIDANDKRGAGWDSIQGTPFQQHQNTGTKRLAIYGKEEAIRSTKTRYFLNYNQTLSELTDDEAKFIFSLSPKSYEQKMPKRLMDMENQEAAEEIFTVENLYDFKNLDLSKISFIRCAMEVDGENKKFSYVNRQVAPSGLNPGDFAKFID